MADYVTTIGLEIHAELKTATKMFCNSKNDPEEGRPNVNICPVCLAHPGTLPVVNRQAVEYVLKVGAAVGGELADYTEFDRKNYFYPDLPKGYQISQYEYPLVKGGVLSGVPLTRIHLEEDTANSKHVGAHSLIDFNRAGVPLMELVTEPAIHDAKTASNFAKELQLLLRTLGAGDANMEKGQMRVEANISVSKTETLGTKTEVKNLNSFKSVERAIEFEVARQIEVLEGGGALVQETRGFNEDTGETFSQRLKESSHDYRYFPDPDIPKFKLSILPNIRIDEIRSGLGELPWVRRERYLSLGVTETDAEVLVTDLLYQQFFEDEVLSRVPAAQVRTAVNYLLSDVRGAEAGDVELQRLSGGNFAELIALIVEGKVSSRGGKDILSKMMRDGGAAKALADSLGVLQVSDPKAVALIAEKIIQDNADVVAQIKAGKDDAMKFLLGQGMKISKGSVNPSALAEELKTRIAEF